MLLCFSIYNDYRFSVKQAKAYNKENANIVQFLNPYSGLLGPIEWKDVKLGHIIKICKDKTVPADIMIISTSKNNGYNNFF